MFRIVHINARSLFNKLSDIMSNFYFCDVVIITETWLTSAIPTSAISIDGFSIIRQDRYDTLTKKGGGICMYIKNDYSYDNMSELCEITPNYEMLGIKVKIRNIKPFYILGTYQPPSGNMGKFIDWLSNSLNNIDYNRTELFILGDMNIDFKNLNLLKKLKITKFETK